MNHRTPSNDPCPSALVPWNPEHFQSTSRAPQSVTPNESCSGSGCKTGSGAQPRSSRSRPYGGEHMFVSVSDGTPLPSWRKRIGPNAAVEKEGR